MFYFHLTTRDFDADERQCVPPSRNGCIRLIACHPPDVDGWIWVLLKIVCVVRFGACDSPNDTTYFSSRGFCTRRLLEQVEHGGGEGMAAWL